MYIWFCKPTSSLELSVAAGMFHLTIPVPRRSSVPADMFSGHWIDGGSVSKDTQKQNQLDNWTPNCSVPDQINTYHLHKGGLKSCRYSPYHILLALTSACCLLSLKEYMCDVIWSVTCLITLSLLVVRESKRESSAVTVPISKNPVDVTLILNLLLISVYPLAQHQVTMIKSID